jgi:hypothetical protein
MDKAFEAPVFLYYRLTSFYQNHRRYVKSVDALQLKGEATVADTCAPLDKNPNNKLPYYPCGLIANSLFNGTGYDKKDEVSLRMYISTQL